MALWFQQLRSSFLLKGTAGAALLVAALAFIGGDAARRTLEHLANERGV